LKSFSLTGETAFFFSYFITQLDRIPAILDHVQAGAQPALHFGGDNFHEISFDDVIVLIQPWYNFFANGIMYF